MEIWKEKVFDFNSKGLLVSNTGKLKDRDGTDRNLSDNVDGYIWSRCYS